MRRAFLVAARRTAVVPQGGAFRGLSVDALGASVLQALLADAAIAPEGVDEVIVSNALGEGGNPARRVALLAGLPERVAGLSIDRQCAGGLDALLLARALIAAGADVVVAGGAESASQRPERRMPGADAPYGQARFTPWPDRDPDMAQAAEALALRLGISRKAADDWAVASHAKAMAARANLRAEILPLAGVADDAFTRALTPALAARATPVTGGITAANAAVAADGAALCLVVSERIAARAARAVEIVSGLTLGGTPDEPGLAPVAAIGAALAAVRLAPFALERAEVMEAYAVQAIACVQGAGLDAARVNLRGGALARGHPIGASGAILAVRLFHDLAGGYGLAAIAAAGGLGTALVLRG
ncbi:acetyl-CoA C-acyltransferase [Paragemmobacter straminiformis]|uniref:Acetyl-CoA C-acyltransferase n=1 Tax=Paragemmobacter straminiformis TaxID=2045119 RepID=A0A842I5W9_9RHOB|nr:acetyl-CoA C-acyltransferase [Gemmobacter straminiformis]MBC2834348.1 acetyl-CoA C-acyltransferase [Gemmobacter straminiformis]